MPRCFGFKDAAFKQSAYTFIQMNTSIYRFPFLLNCILLGVCHPQAACLPPLVHILVQRKEQCWLKVDLDRFAQKR